MALSPVWIDFLVLILAPFERKNGPEQPGKMRKLADLDAALKPLAPCLLATLTPLTRVTP
jgi:hypothetical protein